jgi:hypothetical protein
VNLNGEAARGAQFLGNTYEGHTVANNPREQPQGDAVTLQTAGIFDSLQTGQSLAPMSRSRAVAFEDKSGTPGDVTTRYAAGIVAIPAATIDLSFDLQTSNFTNGRP